MFPLTTTMTTVRFNRLPFEPANRQVIFLGNDPHSRLERFIRGHHDWIVATFARRGLDFCYLPVLRERLLDYHAPHLAAQRLPMTDDTSQNLLSLCHEPCPLPSLIFAMAHASTDR